MVVVGYFRCTECARFSCGITHEDAQRDVTNFQRYFARLSDEQRAACSPEQRLSMHNYAHCFHCKAASAALTPVAAEEVPRGCTLGVILKDEQAVVR